MTPEQASAIGLDRQVLSEMIAEAGLDQRVRQMRLGLPDAEIVDRITGDKTFQGPNGKFDRFRFEQALRQVGYSEQRFINEQRQVLLRRQIMDSLAGGLAVPQAWLEAINQFQNQERSIDYVVLGPAQAGDIPQPTAEELSKYFEARKILFRAPEYRKIEIVQVTPAEIGKWMEIAEADIKRYFDEHRGRYTTPERRHIEQIVFPSMAEAEAADARLKDGLSFAALAAERGLKEKDIDLGTVTKADLVDPAVADAAFSLADGAVSAPIKGRFGAILVSVDKIEPEQGKSFADVAPQIRTEIANERAKAEVQSLHDQVEDARAGGMSLEEAAQKVKLPAPTYDVDRSGRDPAGKPVTGLPHAGEVITAAFASDVGVDNDPVAADGGFIWYSVTAVTPARDRTLDEVKSAVEERWRQDEIATRLKAKAADFLEKLKTGNSFDALAKADDLTVETADKLKRGKATGPISTHAISPVFRTAKDAYGSAEGDQPSQWVVFKVTGVTTPPLEANSADSKRTDEMVRNQESNDIFSQYVDSLESDLGMSVNAAALAQALGNGTPAPDTD